MSKKSKKAERKKKKRQERIRQEKHQRRVMPAVPSFWDDEAEQKPNQSRAMDVERWLRGYALRTGGWVVGFAESGLALQATKALDPVIGPGELAGASAAERAQELAFECMETKNDDKAASLARAALEIDPTNIDARRTLILIESVGDPATGYRRLLELNDEAGAALDQAVVEANTGKLSHVINARPFLRVLHSLMLEAAQQHDLERLAAATERCAHFERSGCWLLIARALVRLHKPERWDYTVRLRDMLPAGATGRLLLEGMLALRHGDRRVAGDLIRQAYRVNPFLSQQLREGGNSPLSELGYEATAIASGVQPLIDALPDFIDWLDDGMPWMDAATIDRALEAYQPPVSRLLELGQSGLREIDAIDYAQKFDIGAQHRQPLERMLSDPVFRHVRSDSHAAFAPIHAWRALAQIGDVSSLPALFAALLDPEVGDWDYEELPEIIGRFAAAALPRALEEHRAWLKKSEDDPLVWALQRILAKIAERDPASRNAVIERLRDVVADRQMNGSTTRASAISHLADLRAVECLPLIEQAYADEIVDTSYVDLPFVRRQMAGEVEDG